MSIGNQVKSAAIIELITVLGHGEIFTRVLDEIKRTNAAIPNATGADKRHKVLADAEIIFTDVVEPVGEAVLRLLIELAVAYLKVQVGI